MPPVRKALTLTQKKQNSPIKATPLTVSYKEGVIIKFYEIPCDEIGYFREEYDFLSNFYPTKVLFDGIIYYNSEAAYQAQKCLQQTDKEQFALLSADEAKRLGKKVEMRRMYPPVIILYQVRLMGYGSAIRTLHCQGVNVSLTLPMRRYSAEVVLTVRSIVQLVRN